MRFIYSSLLLGILAFWDGYMLKIPGNGYNGMGFGRDLCKDFSVDLEIISGTCGHPWNYYLHVSIRVLFMISIIKS